MKWESKLPKVGTTIFSVMSALANEHQAINLSQGFPNYSSPNRLIELVNHYMQQGANQYAPMAGVPKLREQIAQKVDQLYQYSIDANTEITVTAGATQALFTAITTFIHPGDEVILVEPAYDSYRPSIEVNGGIAIGYELTAPDFRIDWQKLGALVGPKTKMIILNTPHNPTGTILRAADMHALEQIVKGTDILILSDEVYEHLIFDGEAHQSMLRYPALRSRALVTFSFGKTFHNTGWKIGYCIAPAPLMAEFRKVHQFNVFSVNTPMQFALADFLEDPEEYLSLPAFYQQKRDFFANAIKGSALKALPSEGTYYQLYDYTAISNQSDVDFAKTLTTDHGVAVIPISVFYQSGRDEKVVRICFAKTEDTLAQAAERLKKL